MAFDGITVAALAAGLHDQLSGGRIGKIAQPEKDELLLTIKKEDRSTARLIISANPSLPLVCLTDENRPAPMQAPNFCMLLRKYINGGRIISVTQPSMERILIFTIEHRNELGDLCVRRLVAELMGKHSNIILCDENDVILDAIRHVSALVSSVREVLPGRPYFIADPSCKKDPLRALPAEFDAPLHKPAGTQKALYTSYTGISPIAASQLCYEGGLDPDIPFDEQPEDKKKALSRAFFSMTDAIKDGHFSFTIYKRDGVPKEFSALPLTVLSDDTAHIEAQPMPDISTTLLTYYRQKAQATRMREKAAGLSHIIMTALARNVKKYDLQQGQLRDTLDRDKYRQYGELLHTYGYEAAPGAKELETLNYYTGQTVRIPLDPTKDFRENAARYFEKYNKKKRTFEALTVLAAQTKAQIDYLQSVKNSLSIASDDSDLAQLQEELAQAGIIKKRNGKKKKQERSSPMHYMTKDGYHIYVGKNNLQNEWLTFSLADGNDWWFHVKDAPGSHVIVKSEGGDLPDHVFEDAARLAAYYSSMRDSDKAEIDYIQKKHVKKPKASPPGFVIYHTNYSMLIDSDISALQRLE